MNRRTLPILLAAAVVLALTAVSAPAGAAKSPHLAITDLTVSPTSLYMNGGRVTVSAAVSSATSCTLSSVPALSGLPTTLDCSGGTFTDNVSVPANSGTTPIHYKFTLKASGATSTKKSVSLTVGTGLPPYQQLSGVISVTDNCALLSSGGVDCWGLGNDGELGNGEFTTPSDNNGVAVPVAVVGAGGSGTLADVVSLAGLGDSNCAVLSSGGVDCWGAEFFGDLGNGVTPTTPVGVATPVPVEGVGGSGTLGGVASLAVDGVGYCALLTTGGVDCWGGGDNGQLGNGQFTDASDGHGSGVPVMVEGVGGSGTLQDVASLYGNEVGQTFCAVLASSAVDCWGNDDYGEVGNGEFTNSSDNDGLDIPASVEAVGGSGLLNGVVSLTGYGTPGVEGGFCALLVSTGVDCWGAGMYGQLGNGQFVSTSTGGSAVPVSVEGLNGTGLLIGAVSLAAADDGYCAVLNTGGVDCWGLGAEGQLGDGKNYKVTGTPASKAGSAVPVTVVGVGGTGALTRVAALSAVVDDGQDYCAVLTSGGADCWGSGDEGQLGNGQFITKGLQRSTVPVVVEGLTDVTSITEDTPSVDDPCATLASGHVECWGTGKYGELGDGVFYSQAQHFGSDVPVPVEASS